MKDLVNYTQALELDKLGFDEKCFTFWTTEGKLYDSEGYYKKGDNVLGEEVLAPTFSQVFRWFREKYRYNCFVTKSINSDKWYYYREDLSDRRNDSEPELTPNFDTYEEAESACLDGLIEIVEQTRITNEKD